MKRYICKAVARSGVRPAVTVTLPPASKPLPPLAESVLSAIHGTPLVELSRLTAAEGVDGSIFAKLEYLSPGGSKKDRIALQMLQDARQSGALQPGQPVVELTSGNTGAGLAIVCAILGHPFIAVMSKGNSLERQRQMVALGAELELVDQARGSQVGQVGGDDLKLVFDAAERVTKERGAFRADQFALEGNFRAHYEHTGPEILQQVATVGRCVDAFVDFVGSGGTFGGVAAALKEHNEEIMCYVLEPKGAEVLASEAAKEQAAANRRAAHSIQGGGYSMAMSSLPSLAQAMPNHWSGRYPNRQTADGYLNVSSEEAQRVARLLATSEGVFGGYSGGANVAAAVELLRGPQRGKNVACCICDSGLKYLSTDLWD